MKRRSCYRELRTISISTTNQYTNPAPSIVPFTLAPGEPITIVRPAMP
jgi:hypothetical protein